MSSAYPTSLITGLTTQCNKLIISRCQNKGWRGAVVKRRFIHYGDVPAPLHLRTRQPGRSFTVPTSLNSILYGLLLYKLQTCFSSLRYNFQNWEIFEKSASIITSTDIEVSFIRTWTAGWDSTKQMQRRCKHRNFV